MSLPFEIGIDGYNFAMPNGTGVATYGMTLAQTLRAHGARIFGTFGIDPGNEPILHEHLFFDRLGRSPPESTVLQRRRAARQRNRTALIPFSRRRAVEIPLTRNVEKAPLAERIPQFDRIVTHPQLFEVAHRHFHYYGRFLRLVAPKPPPIMHWTYPVPVELAGARNIYTLHDLVPLKLPYTTLDAKRSYRRLIAACIARADHICTVSETSHADILAEFGHGGAPITNCYQASPLPSDWPDIGDGEHNKIVESTFGLTPGGYFVFFGAIEPKKNVGRLIEAYLASDLQTPLVIVGGRSWQQEGELYLLPNDTQAEPFQAKRIADRIIRLHHLPRRLLLRLVAASRAVLFPSLYEGFGLPILEGMQVGAPVLTSSISATAEIAGDAALLINPYDVSSIAAALRALDENEALRARLSAAGLVRAANFSQERYHERLTDLYTRTLVR